MARKRATASTSTLKPPGVAAVSRDESGVHVHGRRYSLGEIARGSGVDRTYVTRIFNGKREPGLGVLERMAAFLGLPMDTLLAFLRRGF